jgi:four helix bundle protein
MNTEKKKFDLEDRLIDFAIQICGITDLLPRSLFAKNIAGQITRSSTSPALNYGEAIEAVSRKDFIHKMSICAKELRETKIALKLIQRRNYSGTEMLVKSALNESEQLLAIFASSIRTARNNQFNN